MERLRGRPSFFVGGRDRRKEEYERKYRGWVQIGTDENGKPINKYVCARTKQELEVRKEEMRRHFIDGVAIREDMVLKWGDSSGRKGSCMFSGTSTTPEAPPRTAT